MSLAVTSLGSVGDTAARSDYTCALSRAPGSNTAVMVAVQVTDGAGTAVEPTSVVGAGLVFSLLTSSITFAPISTASATFNLSAWRGMGASPDGSLITATFPNNATGCAILVCEVSGVSTSGISGANAVGGSATSAADSATGVSVLTVIGPSAGSTGNGWLLFAGANTSGDSAGLNYLALDKANYSSPVAALLSAWTDLSTGTMVPVGAGTNQHRAGILIELVLDTPSSGGGGTTSSSPVGRRVRLAPVPSHLTGPIAQTLRLWYEQLNNREGYISIFSGADPNTSGFTGIPGNLLVNVGSASTWTRLWVQGGSVASISTTSWHPIAVV